MRVRTAILGSGSTRGWLGFGIATAGLLVAASAIRWHAISSTSLWLDELGQLYTARLPLPDLLAAVRTHAAAAPLDYLATKAVFHFAEPILGASTVAARLWPLACGVACVAAIELATLELTRSRVAALLAATMATVSGLLVYYSQEARFYSLSVLVAVLATWAFAMAVRQGRRRDWVVYGATAVLGVYTYYFIAYILVLQGAAMFLWAILAAWRVRPWAAAARQIACEMAPMIGVGVVTVLAFLPWYQFAARVQFGIDHGYPIPPGLDLVAIVGLLANLLAAVPRTNVPGGVPVEAGVLVVAIVALAALGIVRIYRSRPQAALAIGLLQVTLIPLVWEMDSRTHYFVSTRQFILIVPFAIICAGAGADAVVVRLSRAAERVRPRSGTIARTLASVSLAVVLVTLSVPSLARVYGGTVQIREDWKAAAAFATSVLCPDGAVYSNLSRGYYYGIGFYAPKTVKDAVSLRVPKGAFLGDVLKSSALAADDVVVAFVPIVWAPGRGTIDTVAQQLASRGFRFKDFSNGRIRVFYNPAGCPRAN